MAGSSRLFFALWPDNQTRLQLLRISKALEVKGFKSVLPNNFHVTLVFLGNIDAATELLIKDAAEEFSAQPVKLIFDQLSYWHKPNVLCLTCSNSVKEIELLVISLNAGVAQCGVQTEIRPYLPHITLCRHAGYLPVISFEPVSWQAESYCLVESCSEPSGVGYHVKQQWPFIAGNASWNSIDK